MTSLLSCLSAILLPLAPVAAGDMSSVARPPVAATRSVFLGKWELDLTRMPDTYGPPPKRVLFEFREIGDGKWRTIVDVYDRDGTVRHMPMAYRPDGRPVPAEVPNGEADAVAVLSPVPDTLVVNLGRAKTLGSVRVYTVLPGGNEMIESAAGLNGDGEPFVRTFHFKRLR
ncbi:hypothetical protein [Sphingomonas hankookensis]